MIYLIISIIILFLGFVFVAFEISYLSLSYPKIYKITNKKIYLENPAGVLFTILLGVNLFSISYAILNFRFFNNFLDEEVSAVISGIFSTIIFVLISEYIPRLVSRANPEFILRIFDVFIFISYYLFYPINFLFKKFSPKKPEDIINFYLDELERAKFINHYEKLTIKRILKFLDMPIKNIVQPYENFEITNLESFQIKQSYKSYIIIFKENERIIGYIYKKDILKLDELDLKDLLRKPIFLNENTTIYEAIKIMKENKTNIIFTNEGIITIDDMWKLTK